MTHSLGEIYSAEGRPAPGLCFLLSPLCFGQEHSLVLPKFPEMMPFTSTLPIMIYFKMPQWLETSSPWTFQETFTMGCEEVQELSAQRTKPESSRLSRCSARWRSPTLTLKNFSQTCHGNSMHCKAPNTQCWTSPRPVGGFPPGAVPKAPGSP